MMMDSVLVVLMLVALVPLCGVLMALTPSFMPRSECFTVTIPESAQSDWRIVRMKRIYLIVVLSVSAAATLIAVLVLPSALILDDVVLFSFTYAVVVVVPMGVGFGLMLKFRKSIRAIKQQEGWIAQESLSSAVVGEGNAPEPLSMAWNLLYVPVLVLVAELVWALYPLMPDQIPMQTDLAGNVTRAVAKSPATACFPLLVAAFMAAVFAFCNWSIIRSKREVNPRKPSSSAFAYGAFARSQSILLLACGLVLCLAIGVALPLSFVGIVTMLQAALIILGVTVVVVVAVMVVTLRFGQSGSRVFSEMAADDGISRDEDACWKLGVFYVNSQDPAVFVPKRFGFGWIVNFGSVKTWLIIAAFVAVTAAFVGLCFVAI